MTRAAGDPAGSRPGPARAGLFVYAKDVERLSAFYVDLLDMTRAHATPQMTVLRSPDLQLVVRAMPPERAVQVTVATPPVPRDDAAIKFFHAVPSLAQAAETAAALGGAVWSEQYRGPGFVVCNAVDPEGNIFQVREYAPA